MVCARFDLYKALGLRMSVCWNPHRVAKLVFCNVSKECAAFVSRI